jgi:hypothetical protein
MLKKNDTAKAVEEYYRRYHALGISEEGLVELVLQMKKAPRRAAKKPARKK